MPTAGARILARCIVFVAGLPPAGDAASRRRRRAFTRYGRVARVLVMPRGGSAAGSGGLYVVYGHEADAASAVRGMAAGGVDGRDVKAVLATTRYCDQFLSYSTFWPAFPLGWLGRGRVCGVGWAPAAGWSPMDGWWIAAAVDVH